MGPGAPGELQWKTVSSSRLPHETPQMGQLVNGKPDFSAPASPDQLSGGVPPSAAHAPHCALPGQKGRGVSVGTNSTVEGPTSCPEHPPAQHRL